MQKIIRDREKENDHQGEATDVGVGQKKVRGGEKEEGYVGVKEEARGDGGEDEI